MAKTPLELEESLAAPRDVIHDQPADRYQREFSLLNRFGLQANVIIAASYANSESQDLVLSKALIYPALRQVVRQYPELGLINYCRSSERKRSQHRLYSAVLQNINLDAHVQFINIPREEEDAGLGTTIERYHGLWFDPSKTPPWRLVVVNGRHALLVFDHFITDARGGLYILESLLEALNAPEEDQGCAPVVDLTIDIQGFPEPDPVTQSYSELSFLVAILNYLRFYLIAFLYHGKNLFFYDSAIQARRLSFDSPEKEENMVVTKIQTLQLSPETMSKCLHACRNHQTSFTSLLHTLIKVTLATEFYPDAKFNHSQLALDVRPYIKPHNRKHVMSCSVSIISSFDWLSQFRRAGKQTSTSGDTLDDADLLWELARKHRAYVLNDIHHKQSWKTAWLSIQLIGEDEEDYAKDFIRGLKLAQPNCFSISNLGAYDASQSASQAVHNGPWSITNMEFSAGAWKSGFGANLNFNVAGVRNGSTIIHANHEVGAFSDDFLSSVLKRVETRLAAII